MTPEPFAVGDRVRLAGSGGNADGRGLGTVVHVVTSDGQRVRVKWDAYLTPTVEDAPWIERVG